VVDEFSHASVASGVFRQADQTSLAGDVRTAVLMVQLMKFIGSTLLLASSSGTLAAARRNSDRVNRSFDTSGRGILTPSTVSLWAVEYDLLWALFLPTIRQGHETIDLMQLDRVATRILEQGFSPPFRFRWGFFKLDAKLDQLTIFLLDVLDGEHHRG
jgi:hypothetical protein